MSRGKNTVVVMNQRITSVIIFISLLKSTCFVFSLFLCELNTIKTKYENICLQTCYDLYLVL